MTGYSLYLLYGFLSFGENYMGFSSWKPTCPLHCQQQIHPKFLLHPSPLLSDVIATILVHRTLISCLKSWNSSSLVPCCYFCYPRVHSPHGGHRPLNNINQTMSLPSLKVSLDFLMHLPWNLNSLVWLTRSYKLPHLTLSPPQPLYSLHTSFQHCFLCFLNMAVLFPS